MPVPYRFFLPSDAARMGRLHLTARQVVEGVLTGRHKSPHRGFSAEFTEHRDYVPGDELRHLDWRAYARSDRYYIKLFEQETNLRATIVLDTSNSMRFGNKLDYARHLAACLAYLLAMQQDLAGLAAADESIRLELPAGSSPSHLDRLFRALEQITPGAQTNLPDVLHSMADRLPRRSMLLLISDFWLDAGALLKALQHLRHRKHQIMALHLLDRAEIDLPYDRVTTFHDLETGEQIEVDPAHARSDYRREVEQHLASIRRAFLDADAEYHAIHTDEPYDQALVRLLARNKGKFTPSPSASAGSRRSGE